MMRKKRRSSVDISKDAMPTEMSMSKKSRTTGRQAKAVAKEDTSNDSVFGQFIRQSGVILKQGSTANEIAVDQVVFQKRLQQQLKKSPRYPGVLQEFITGLESHIEDPERFRNCLLPCVPCLADGDSSSFQESLLRMLLGIEMLQVTQPFAGEDGLNIPHVIVNQLKWLDRVKDSKELAGKLMQLVSVAPVEIQRDIITSLPEILEDSQHSDIARELNVLLQENTQLTVPILDALSSLNLSSTLLTEVRASVMATLSAVQLEDLPVVVKFILHSISSSDALEVREHHIHWGFIEATCCRFWSDVANRSTDTSAPSSSQDSVALVLDSIKSAVRFQKTISEAWLKAIENADAAEGHKAVDLLVLFILHSTNANHSRRGAEKVLKVKVRAGQIQEALLQRTFRGHSQVRQQCYFPSILALAQTLLRCPDPCMVAFGGHMYRHSFTAFDSYCQQEVVGSLVTHVCSGVGGEVDVALELLCGLVTEKPAEMALYAVFVKGVLDYMDNLTPQQIRRLFHLLSSMAFRQHHPASHIQDDMHIVIRKQLSSTVLKYKRIGIIGAVRVVGSMGVTALLELVRSCSDSSSEAAALYYDELSNLTQRRVSPLCLAPFFRLLRLCEVQQRHGDLEEIDALLGCPLILTDMDVVNKSESLSRPEREFLCGLLFYTINWFREVVNAFCGQKDPEMKMKVVTRLQNITYLQSILEQILAATPGYSPPLANFDGESTEGTALSTSTVAPKKGKKGVQALKLGGIQLMSKWHHIPARVEQKDKETSKPAVSLVSYRPFFRELDMEVLGVLQCGLLSRSVLDSELHSKEVQLGPAELVFLLEDMWRKLEFKLTVSPAKRAPFLKVKRSVGFSHLQQTSPVDLASRCVLLLPTLCTHLENCHNHFQVNTHKHASRIAVVSSFMTLCPAVCRHCCLRTRASSSPWLGEEATTLHTGSRLVRRALKQVLSFIEDQCRCVTAPPPPPLATLARAFLCQEWVTTSGDREKGPKHNETLQTLLSIYLEHTDDVLKAVEEIAGEGIPELLNAAKDASSRTWPTLNRLTFLVFYKGMMGELEKAVRKIPPGRHSDSTEVKSEKLLTWNMAVRDFHILVNLVKVFDNRSVLNVCLKYGRLFLESFLKLGMPLLDFSFKKHKEDVQSLLKTFQLSTRQLHHLCGHSKVPASLQLCCPLHQHLPGWKCFSVVFIMCVKTKCFYSFVFQGQEILSQQSQGSDDEEEEGSLMPDEHSEDEVLAIINF
uniref:FA complementation group D2 n=1 Tax=Esox lucius TaxID=8010 RepID=A0A3P8YP23_ESOLU